MKIITTVGTSLISNAGEESSLSEEKKFDISNFSFDSNYYKSYIKKKEENLLQFLKNGNTCAELATLKKIDSDGKSRVFLLCTETVESYICGRVLQRYIGERSEVEYIEGLQVNDANKFKHSGFFNLTKRVREIKHTDENEVLLNISGGYKALIPPITLLAQLEKIPLYYIYEDSDELIETGNLPINFDWGTIEAYVVYLNKDNERKNADDVIITEMRELKLIEQTSKELTIIGQMLAEYSKRPSPFTETIFGYLIEHKLYEMYVNERGPENVEHSVKVGKGTDDIDLLIKPCAGEFISVEIKPFDVLRDKGKMEDKIIGNIIRRTTAVSGTDKKGRPIEAWLLLYSYAADKNQIIDISDFKKDLDKYSETVKDAFENNVQFKIYHYFIQPNKLGNERLIYHHFLKSKIKSSDVQEIFPNQTLLN